MRHLWLSLALAACAGTPAEAPHAEPASPVVKKEAPAPAPANAAAITIGQMAPDFTLTDTGGTARTLSAQRGNVVVLEWYNPDCPFVKAAHGEGPLNDMASRWADKDVVWWAINSGAPGNEGHGAERNAASLAEYSLNHAILLDEEGTVGRLYQAKTTPQMLVIAPDGNVAYAGALDNAPLNDSKGAAREPWFENALAQVVGGKPVTLARTKSWGCGVKY